jgi:hypothetical protein
VRVAVPSYQIVNVSVGVPSVFASPPPFGSIYGAGGSLSQFDTLDAFDTTRNLFIMHMNSLVYYYARVPDFVLSSQVAYSTPVGLQVFPVTILSPVAPPASSATSYQVTVLNPVAVSITCPSSMTYGNVSSYSVRYTITWTNGFQLMSMDTARLWLTIPAQLSVVSVAPFCSLSTGTTYSCIISTNGFLTNETLSFGVTAPSSGPNLLVPFIANVVINRCVFDLE